MLFVIGDNVPIEDVTVCPLSLYSLVPKNVDNPIVSVNLTDCATAVSLTSAYTNTGTVPLIFTVPSKLTNPVSHDGASADNIVLPTLK